jgi:alkylhydroperoxidase/carboxymuconolactone decarboxylase family protein YurZ
MPPSRKPRESRKSVRTAVKTDRSVGAARPDPTRARASGNWNPDWEPFAKLDPAWTEKVVGLAIAPAVSGALDPKTVEFLGIALNAAYTQVNAPALRRHVRRALALGATRQEITAVLQCASLLGFRSLCFGAPILLEELEAAGRTGA